MRSLTLRATACIGLVWALAAPAIHAQDDNEPVSVSAEERATAETHRAEARDRVTGMLRRRAVRRVAPEVIAADARRIVAGLADRQVEALIRGEKLATVLTDPRLAGDAAVQSGGLQSAQTATDKAVGDPESELLFVPVEPCRVIDTRLGGGALAANETRAFEVSGTANFAAQGGDAAGCGIPLGAATPLAPAVVINFIAVGPSGPGNLRAWEFGQPVPNASVINYANVPGLNIANGVIVPIAGVASLDKDLNIRADVSGTHVVADVTGYFTRFPVEQFQGALKSFVITNDVTTLTSMSDGACHELNSCTITTQAAGTVIVEAWGQFVANHTGGTTDRVAIGIETVSPVVCNWDDNSVNASDFEVSGALSSSPDVDFTVSHGRGFSQAAGATRTYRLSGKMFSGANSGDAIENSRIICTFIPD